MRPAHFLICDAPSLSWKAGRLPSAAASPSVGKNRERSRSGGVSISVQTPARGMPSLCWLEISSYQTVGIDLLGFDSLLRCDLLDVFLSLLQPLRGEK